jgi:hypothetical protein
MTIELVGYSTTAASNNSASPNGWPEGMAPSGVNNSARENMAGIARNVRDTQGYTTAGGTANALTIALNATTAAEATGERITFKASATNTAAATVTVTPSGASARTARNIFRNGVALTGGEIISGCYYTIDWDGTQYELANPNPVALVTGRNLLINGEMKVAQRGTSIASVQATAYTLDQWIYFNQGTGAGIVTASQSSTVPNTTFASSLKIDVTTVDSSIAAGDHYAIAHRVEGLRCSRLGFGGANAQSVALSFWIRVDSTDLSFPATFTGALQNSASNRAYPFTYSVTASATWQKIVVTLSGDTSGTWLQTSGVGLRLFLSLACGSTYQGTANAWAASDVRGTSAQVNFMNHANNDLYLTGVQLEAGTVATPFEFRDYAEDLQLCRRYLWRRTRNATNDQLWDGRGLATTNAVFTVNYPVEMRVAASLTVSNVADFVVRVVAGNIDTTNLSSFAERTDGMGLLSTTAASMVDNGAHALAFDGTSGGWLQFSAEM